ncbi:hypothetical protein NLJ89_g946 [Agrocybe chaxingu]|uniref:Uncharacterized protein n=1 Tax=Agrocybe chaxingu TaxID=84603 RepID=A0A9W8N0W2_9AGAR|nr:hypothetical protein NLJ89_g946 [Agrocybe chaxingu]
MSHLVPNQSPPPVSRPSSSAGSSATLLQPPKLLLDPEEVESLDAESRPSDSPGSPLAPSTLDHMLSVSPPSPVMKDLKGTPKLELPPSMVPQEDHTPMSSYQRPVSMGNTNASSLKTTPVPFPDDSQGSLPESTPKKPSTFRRVPLKSTRGPQPSSHLRNVSLPSLPSPPSSGNVAQEERSASVSPSSSFKPDNPSHYSPTLFTTNSATAKVYIDTYASRRRHRARSCLEFCSSLRAEASAIPSWVPTEGGISSANG